MINCIYQVVLQETKVFKMSFITILIFLITILTTGLGHAVQIGISLRQYGFIDAPLASLFSFFLDSTTSPLASSNLLLPFLQFLNNKLMKHIYLF